MFEYESVHPTRADFTEDEQRHLETLAYQLGRLRSRGTLNPPVVDGPNLAEYLRHCAGASTAPSPPGIVGVSEMLTSLAAKVEQLSEGEIDILLRRLLADDGGA